MEPQKTGPPTSDSVSGAAPSQGKCQATRKDGSACRATATSDGRCPWHSTRYTDDQRHVWTRRGALTANRDKLNEKLAAISPPQPPEAGLPQPDFKTSRGIVSYLQKIATMAEHGKLAPSLAQAAIAAAQLAVKVAELQLELDMLDLELERERDPRRDEDNVRVISERPS